MAWRRCFLQLLLPLAWLWFDGVSAAYEVAVLGDSNFKSTVEGSDSNWLLEFYAVRSERQRGTLACWYY